MRIYTTFWAKHHRNSVPLKIFPRSPNRQGKKENTKQGKRIHSSYCPKLLYTLFYNRTKKHFKNLLRTVYFNYKRGEGKRVRHRKLRYCSTFKPTDNRLDRCGQSSYEKTLRAATVQSKTDIERIFGNEHDDEVFTASQHKISLLLLLLLLLQQI